MAEELSVKKLFVIDGNSLIEGVFYNIPIFKNSKNIPINAISGFFKLIIEQNNMEQADYIVCLFNNNAYLNVPEELAVQVPLILELLKKMNICIIEIPDSEMTDSVLTDSEITNSIKEVVTKITSKMGDTQVVLFSANQKLCSLVNEKINLKLLEIKDGKTEINTITSLNSNENIEIIKQKETLVDDNKIEIEIRNIDFSGEAYIRLCELECNLVADNLLQNVNNNNSNMNISHLVSASEVKQVIENLIQQESVAISILSENIVNGKNTTEVENGSKPKLEEKNIENDGQFSLFDISENNLDEALLGDKTEKLTANNSGAGRMCVALSDSKQTYYLDSKELTVKVIQDMLAELQKHNLRFVTANVKKLYSILDIKSSNKKDTAEVLTQNYDDVILMAYLINPLKNDYSVSDISSEYLNKKVDSYENTFGKSAWTESDKIESFLCMQSETISKCYMTLSQKLKNEDMYMLYRSIEMPLTFVLYSMEKEGMKIDAKALADYGNELQVSIDALEEKIYEQAGKEFNINSPKQLGEILFEEMGLQGAKKTKTGYSTSAEVLEKLAPECPMVADILEYRTVTKLKSTYADGLANYIAEDGRIHTNFNQTITATGRISSTEPNLQNIPMRMELGRKIRKVFIPRNVDENGQEKEYVFVDADYSQIELRILAAMAGDKELIEAYRSNKDIHRITAAKVFHVPFEDVTDLQRRNAKAVNFGIVYGISSFGLSQDLSITTKEAKKYIEDYFATYPGINTFLENAKAEAKREGYSSTLYKRKRPIPELSSSNFMQRSFGERVAMNAPIQGTAADIMKIAMIRVFNRLLADGLKAKLVLQVHDELLIEAPKEEEEIVLNILQEEMVHAADLPVQLEVEAHSGTDWYEAK